jgi:hypothetical protein
MQGHHGINSNNERGRQERGRVEGAGQAAKYSRRKEMKRNP